MLQNAVKRSVMMPPSLEEALVRMASARRRDTNSIIVQALEDYAVAAGARDPQESGETGLFWSLVDRVSDTARELCRSGEFVPEITLRAIERRMSEDPVWPLDYRRYVGDDIFKSGNPRKGPINREIGFRVREAIGGTIRLDATGKPVMLKVLGSIVQSVTLMDSFDPEAVGR